MYSYSPRVSPPGPFLFVRVSPSETSAPIGVHAILDTGADNSALPASAVEQLRLPQVDAGMVGGIDGHMSLEPLFAVFVSIEAGPPEEVEVHSFPMPFAVLGHDILNQYHITLDGPNLTLTVTR